ncbi:DUF1269 domain-containing protein [Ruania alkalisoli]|uniref:DUF1269 domain-containing protein n=1 Tax=Ruania alkalisoli TaxID=2779775 RepID=A0A7M1SUN2_9MICO|nr:DUF1269 domain-containing protein [Ruania alkalisoli]QOR71191.1 DUF1269 domain-containing protein [Ruania alkalisoli]
MTTFTAWKFATVEGGETAAQTLKQAWGEGLVKVEDYAVVEWPIGADHPKVKYEDRDNWRAAGWGALIGAVLGSLFFLPAVGAAAGAAINLLRKRAEGIGITSDQLDAIGKEVVPGTSALFVVTSDADRDRLAERFHGQQAELVASNLVQGEARDVERAFEN